MHERKKLRLSGYDYATPGAYFITACVHDRKNEFGFIENGMMKLNESGKIVDGRWRWLFDQYEYLKIDGYCVMPNHFHGIIWISPVSTVSTVGNGRDRSLRDINDHSPRGKIKPIPELIGAFKTTSSKLIHIAGNMNFKWQKSYYDVIIRNDESFQRITDYIKTNPKYWGKDDFYN